MTLPRVNCPRCGVENIDGVESCVSCGNDLRAVGTPPQQPLAQPPVYGQPQQPYGYPPVAIPNYLAQSILVTLCCCLPAGIPAIVFAAQVDSKARTGDIAGAMAASKNAKTWCWVSFGLGLALVALQLIWMLVGIGGAMVDLPQ